VRFGSNCGITKKVESDGLATTSAGQYFDAGTGKHYNYFRDYDASIGRYLESDPIGLPGGLNTFAYVYSQPLLLIDRDGLRAGRAFDPDPEYRWQPDPRDWYPEPVDGACMLVCVAIDVAMSHALFEVAGRAGSAMAGSSSGAARVTGAAIGLAARGMGHTPAGAIIDLGLATHGCQAHCPVRKVCEIPDWAKSYQNMPLPPLTSAFPH
jgi:RHS repeat-associated protein